MDFRERLKRWWLCKRRGHRFLIDEYDKRGVITGSQCIHCGKRITAKGYNV